MRRSLGHSLALAVAATLAGAAVADPADDTVAPRPKLVCDKSTVSRDGPDCAAEPAVIDHLPDSFFSGGGGVGPQEVEGGRRAYVWVRAEGGTSADAAVRASVFARVRVVSRTWTRDHP